MSLPKRRRCVATFGAMLPVDELVRIATDLIAVRGDGQTHSVATVVQAADETVATGLNLFHFTGGPCAELTALANLASLTSSPARLIVAVGDHGCGVLAPCGRCRQVLLDAQPGGPRHPRDGRRSSAHRRVLAVLVPMERPQVDAIDQGSTRAWGRLAL